MRRLTALFICLLVCTGLAFSAGKDTIFGVPRNETLIFDCHDGQVMSPDNFNVWIPGSNHSQGFHQAALESLWFTDPVTGVFGNSLASEKPVYNSDFTEMTVKLRKGIYWSDGIEFTADDLIYTVEAQKKNSGLIWSAQFNLEVEKVEKVDNYSVVFHLKAPDSRFHSVFLIRYRGCYIMPKHVFEKQSDIMSFKYNPPVVLGPYTLKDYDHNGFWFLWERREDWQRTVTGVLFGKPAPKYALYHYVGGPEQRVIAQSRHELDHIFNIPLESLLALLKKNPTSKPYNSKFPYMYADEPAAPGLTLNNDVYPLNIKDVRWALALTANIVDGIMLAYGGAARMTALPLSPTTAYMNWYYKPLQDWITAYEIDLGKGEKYRPYNPDIPKILAQKCKEKGFDVSNNPEEIRKTWGYGWWKYDEAAATKLLSKNGFTKKGGKWYLPDGKPFVLRITVSGEAQSTVTRLGFSVADAWRKFGIDVTTETSDLIWTLAANGDYQVAMTWPVECWGGHPDLFRYLGYWHSEYYRPIGQREDDRRQHRWKSVKLDKVIEEMKTVDFDSKRNIELGVEAVKIIVDEMPIIPMVGYIIFNPFDEYYWTGEPTASNPYTDPVNHWQTYKNVFPFLKPTGK